MKKVKVEEKQKSLDILFLEYKLKKLVEQEEYERASVIKRWIEELSEKHK